MTREEILSTAKPILFNTDMVRAIQDGRKTTTRQVLKTNKYIPNDAVFGYTAFTTKDCISCRGTFFDKSGERYGENFIKLPYKIGDILYVRETWGIYEQSYMEANYILYRADFPNGAKTFDADGVSCDLPTWRPSIHMPKEVARIFLRVTDVRMERLQDITFNDCLKEGVRLTIGEESDLAGHGLYARNRYSGVWNSTVNKSDLDKYGWEANPWVWVIEFERVEIE